MTQDVLAQGGGDGRGGGPGRAVGVVVAAVLLAVAAVAVVRSRPGGEPRARPTPSASPAPSQGWTEHPVDGSPTIGPAPEFREYVTVPRPPPGVLRAALLPYDEPGFLVPAGDPADEPLALSALGGEPHDRVVVGWCAALDRFQDQAGTYAYDQRGNSLRTGPGLARHQVRRSPRDRLRLDIDALPLPALDARSDARQRACPDPVYQPALPPAAATVHGTIRAFRVVRGRYVASTERRAFCALSDDLRCRGRGWESFGLGSLPPGDLAGSYTWEGRFVVRGDENGTLVAARLPGVRLVRRERVGVQSVELVIDDAAESVEGLALTGLLSGDPVTYVLRPDAEVFLGPGLTGLGKPRGTAATLRVYLMTRSSSTTTLALVLDARGRVLRVVVPPFTAEP